MNQKADLQKAEDTILEILKELDEIKQNIERVAEKQHRLKNLMSFYTGEFAR